MGLLYTRSLRLAIEKRFLCDAICLLVYFHRAEEASEGAGEPGPPRLPITERRCCPAVLHLPHC